VIEAAAAEVTEAAEPATAEAMDEAEPATPEAALPALTLAADAPL